MKNEWNKENYYTNWEQELYALYEENENQYKPITINTDQWKRKIEERNKCLDEINKWLEEENKWLEEENKQREERKKQLEETNKWIKETNKWIKEENEKQRAEKQQRAERYEEKRQEYLKRKLPKFITKREIEQYKKDPVQYWLRHDLRDKLYKAKKVYQTAMKYQDKHDYDLNDSTKKLAKEIEYVQNKLDNNEILSEFDITCSLTHMVICPCQYHKYEPKWYWGGQPI